MSDEENLVEKLRSFVHERDWGQFHDPKNLSMALVVEAGELVEIFQWLTSDESGKIMNDPTEAERVSEEIADVYGYLLLLADNLGISLNDALANKIKINVEKYPIEQFRGTAKKYDEMP